MAGAVTEGGNEAVAEAGNEAVAEIAGGTVTETVGETVAETAGGTGSSSSVRVCGRRKILRGGGARVVALATGGEPTFFGSRKTRQKPELRKGRRPRLREGMSAAAWPVLSHEEISSTEAGFAARRPTRRRGKKVKFTLSIAS